MGAARNSTSKEADRRKSLGAAASAASPMEGSTGVEPDEGSGSGVKSKGPRLSGAALVGNCFFILLDFALFLIKYF